ncbi:MAG: hypothetical protein ACRD11_02060 [Terriglobia bacterium]
MYKISGVFNYGGGNANTIKTIDTGVSITLNGSGASMTPDGTTNGLATLSTLDGSLTLTNGATVGGTLASLTLGTAGSLEVDGGTLDLSTINLTNLSGGILTGGSYELLDKGAQENATLKLPGYVNTLRGLSISLS